MQVARATFVRTMKRMIMVQLSVPSSVHYLGSRQTLNTAAVIKTWNTAANSLTGEKTGEDEL